MSDSPTAPPSAAFASSVIVTGAAGGIGRACALAAARAGAAVTLADRDPERLAAVAAEIGPGALAVPADVTDEAQCVRLVEAAVERHGRIDGMVLSAGVARHVPLTEMTLREWQDMLAVHLTSAFLCLREAARAMTGGGSVVCIASSAAAGLGPLHQAHYVAAKAGALGLVRAAARELGPAGIRVNAVSPGFTATPMNDGLFTAEDVRRRELASPLGRVANPEDVAAAVTYLLSDATAFTTGQTLHVNGGTHMP
ncbi:SDR family NAD(P)-dependent oxidoreductase [Nonomuraea aridisoli]|uniref:Ketoreductase domain-containing protein n=1 Tax=Nonomuraea aridisoli TaxID=2070368 RepID=A0A2W2DWP6_9ACTN|nr:SDR family NAD(P)-dependent oxidoreductase [Nonomuraea aridisoli]PZG14601.1 hypothetical protein C1J01_26525 [Nonomuraea aridisoli]